MPDVYGSLPLGTPCRPAGYIDDLAQLKRANELARERARRHAGLIAVAYVDDCSSECGGLITMKV